VKRNNNDLTIECGSEVECCLFNYYTKYSNSSFYLESNNTHLVSLNSMEQTYFIEVIVMASQGKLWWKFNHTGMCVCIIILVKFCTS